MGLQSVGKYIRRHVGNQSSVAGCSYRWMENYLEKTSGLKEDSERLNQPNGILDEGRLM